MQQVAVEADVYQCPDGTEFPVAWPSEHAATLGWRWDQMHCPLPLTPLSASLFRTKIEGFARVMD